MSEQKDEAFEAWQNKRRDNLRAAGVTPYKPVEEAIAYSAWQAAFAAGRAAERKVCLEAVEAVKNRWTNESGRYACIEIANRISGSDDRGPEIIHRGRQHDLKKRAIAAIDKHLAEILTSDELDDDAIEEDITQMQRRAARRIEQGGKQ